MPSSPSPSRLAGCQRQHFAPLNSESSCEEAWVWYDFLFFSASFFRRDNQVLTRLATCSIRVGQAFACLALALEGEFSASQHRRALVTIAIAPSPLPPIQSHAPSLDTTHDSLPQPAYIDDLRPCLARPEQKSRRASRSPPNQRPPPQPKSSPNPSHHHPTKPPKPPPASAKTAMASSPSPDQRDRAGKCPGRRRQRCTTKLSSQ